MNKTVSPIVVEIIRNALNSAAHEMNNCLARSAFSPLIYEMKDCSVGIFDTDGEMLGQSAGLPIFLGNLDICIKILNEKVGLENYKEGDLVKHKQFGEGTVKTIVDGKRDYEITVEFDQAGQKRMLASFAKLEKL